MEKRIDKTRFTGEFPMVTASNIHYEVAEIVPADRIAEKADEMLKRNDVSYVHMRSSRYNCYQCRIERA